jgi:hypothetical protein
VILLSSPTEESQNPKIIHNSTTLQNSHPRLHRYVEETI